MPEILAPAGSRDSFEAAVAAGADAVYLALPKFGARAYAANFSLDELKDVIARAHLRGMKVYVTMNTILFEEETEPAFEQAKAVYEAGADALIVQDLGLMHMLKHRLPDLEVHASTQVSVNRPAQMERLKALNVKRVVLARECTLEQIRACAAVPDMETEVFIHGALCISWSGQCQFSAVRHGRSGNRGQCAQACRMEYTLLENGRPLKTEGSYLLSPKDLSVIDSLDELEEAGVDSFKIEGRMKSPFYVYEAVDNARKRKKRSRQDRLALAAAFSRGFTEGHIRKAGGADLMAMKAGNHQGILIGKVTGGSRERVRIRLEHPLHQEDGLRFVWDSGTAGGRANFIYDRKGKLIREATAGDEVEVPVSEYVPRGAAVRLTVDAFHTREVEHLIARDMRQQPVRARLSCKGPDHPLILTLSCQGHEVRAETEPVQAATGKGLDAERLKRQTEKSGSSWAEIQVDSMDVAPGIFLPVSSVNELRRQGLQKLEELLKKTPTARETPYDYRPPRHQAPDLMIQIQKPEQKRDADALWVSEFPIPGTEKKAALYEDHGLVTAHLGDGRILDGLNLTNSWAVAAVLEMGYEAGVLSEELSPKRTQDLLKGFRDRYGFEAPVLIPVWQKRRLMLMDYCPVNTVKKDGTRKNCSLCRQNRYELEGKDGCRQFLYGDPSCRMQIFDTQAEDRIGQVPERAGKLIRFTDETAEEADRILQRIAGTKAVPNSPAIENDVPQE